MDIICIVEQFEKSQNLMMSVFCSNTYFCFRLLEMQAQISHFFQKLTPSVFASCTFAMNFFLLYHIQSFCHLLKILLKTLEVQYVPGQTPRRLRLKHHYTTFTKQKQHLINREAIYKVLFQQQQLVKKTQLSCLFPASF